MHKLLHFFQHSEAGAGVLLLIFAALALIVANSPLYPAYDAFLNLQGTVAVGSFAIDKPLLLWVNDGHMAIFFFLIGLEIKRELTEGYLSDRSQLVLPGVAAIMGIAIPALIYVFLNGGDPIALRAWAVPSATDIAFALGVFAIFGKSLPFSLKLFLLSVAIFDDIGAIIIIALFYSQDLSLVSLLIAAIGMVVLFIFNRRSVNSYAPYIIVGAIVWCAVLKSGVHATLAGFAVALMIPNNLPDKQGNPMLVTLEEGLHPWVSLLILPLFAFSNAGVNLSGIGWEGFTNTTSMGIALGLFFGKQIGIFGACYFVIKTKIAAMPTNANMLQLYGVSILCGIGFTMSLFIGSLAFEGYDAAYLNSVKIGVLFGSFISMLAGAIVITIASKREKKQAMA